MRRPIRDRFKRLFEKVEKQAVYGAVSLGTIIGVIAVLIVKGCT
jgi:hypothetical protein